MTAQITTRISTRGETVIAVDGEIDLANAAQLDDAIAAARASAPETVAIDLSSTAYLDSAGLRVLLAHASDCKLVVYAPESSTIAAVLALIGLDKIATVVGGRDGAGGARDLH